MRCGQCGTENRAGRKFCAECGTALAVLCAACGAANEPGERFCGECGAALESASAEPRPVPPPSASAPVAERRLVSVLFADLVGFTTASEGRDPEEVRELLSRYFEAARRVVDRFGGSVEKFIGDAVMAVWGAPIAREDDAERAVRAALDIVDAVAALGAEANVGDLRARAGVLMGEAAVTLGAEGEGMVAGDLVNTVSRVQALAEPGTVLVGEGTRRASEAAIVYEEAGTHELRGKAEPVPLWRARRVVAFRGGEGRSAGLEAPFVGRDAEFRLVKDLFHATADERKARLVSIVGVAGVGKSRLSWEFEKYIDGLVFDVWWHRGRCLPYGEGVAYWALAEMVRMRLRIAEEEDPASVREKLRLGLEQYVHDAGEREWLEPRLAHLLGLTESNTYDRDDLFSAWRLFFERLADANPTVLVLEDLQWADRGLVDFVEYLLEWSRNHPLFVVTLARPEIAERHPAWGAAKRNFSSLFLEPLPDQAMDELLRGLVPGLPDDLTQRIRDRAEGIPLYAVETVRMLLDRGLLERHGDEYRPVGDVGALQVPETLHALIAARLDGLEPEERRALSDAAVLGKTFTKEALAAIAGSDGDLESVLAALVRKEVLTLQAGPRSPERGHYGFLQALVQKVAHDTISRRERKVRHLAAAAYYERDWGSDEDELPEIVAAHYLEAYRSDPDAEDAAEIKSKALEQLERAGERAASLAAPAEAQRYFDQAAELAEEPLDCARLLERAGNEADATAAFGEAANRYARSVELYSANGRTHKAAGVSARLGTALWLSGEIDAAVERLEASYAVLAEEEPDVGLGSLCAELGRLKYFKGEHDEAEEWLERSLAIAEALWLPEVLAQALNTKHLVLGDRGRHEEAMALLQHSLTIARENDAIQSMLRSAFNLSFQLNTVDRYEAGLAVDEEGLEVARRLGVRNWEVAFLQHSAAHLFHLGRWPEAREQIDELVELAPDSVFAEIGGKCTPKPQIALYSGEGPLLSADEAAALEDTSDLQYRAAHDLARSTAALAAGRMEDALEAGEAAARFARGWHHFAKEAFPVALEAAFALGRSDRIDALLAQVRELPPGQTPPLLRAHVARFEARLAAGVGDPERAGASYTAAARALRDIQARFWLAATLVEHAEWLAANGGSADDVAALAEEARPILETAGARPWLERLEQLPAPATAFAPS